MKTTSHASPSRRPGFLSGLLERLMQFLGALGFWRNYSSRRLAKVIEAHQLWFSSRQKQGSRAMLSDANLKGANLAETDLRGSDLSRASLNMSLMNMADLREADLSSANLQKAEMRDTDLREANLSQADLADADLTRANLIMANLSRATMGGCIPISVVLADDHNIVRQGLGSLLEGQPDIHVVGEAADGAEATRLVEGLKPDVLVVDIMMDGMNGIEVARHVRKVSPKTCVVFLSMHADEGYVMEALRAGAKAYVLKDSIADDLLHAIRAALVGRRYLSPPLSEHATEAYLHKQEGTELRPHERLTVREREVLHLLAEGLSNTEIASRLCVSRRTIEAHRASVMRKLGLHNQVQLLRYVVQEGIGPTRK